MGRKGRRSVRSRSIGAAALAAAVVSAGVTVAGGLPVVAAPEAGGSLFGPAQVVLVAALVLLGSALLLRGRDRWTLPAVAVTGLVAAELAGVGVVSVRRWGLFIGSGAAPTTALGWEQGRVVAAVMGAVCAGVALACLVVLLRSRRRPHPVRAALAVAAGAAVAVLAPLSVRAAGDDRSDVLAWAVMYALPLGVALALSAFLPLRTSLCLVLVVMASVLVAPLGRSFLEAMVPSGPAQPVVLLAAGAVAVCLVVERVRGRDGRSGLATPPT